MPKEKAEKSLCMSGLRHAEYYGMQEVFDGLYAKSSKNETFTNLMNIILKRENILLAYRNIKSNDGSKTPGTDGVTFDDIGKLMPDEVIDTVRFITIGSTHGYRPKPVRRKEIPKPYDPTKTRPLGIPCVWDRLVQQCIKQVMEPICEAKFSENSYGFRPNRSAENAIARAEFLIQNTRLHYVVEFDVKGFFDNVDHSKLIKQIWSLGIRDKNLLFVLKRILKAPIRLENGAMEYPTKGTPQGGIISPLLANIVLNELDQWVDSQWQDNPVTAKYKTSINANGSINKSNAYKFMRRTNLKEMYIVRYADDFRIFCRTKDEAERTMKAVTQWLMERLHLEVSPTKTRIVNVKHPVPIANYHNIVAKPTEIQKSMVQELSERASKVHSGAVDPSVDNMLKITSDGRKLGLDQRIINPDLPDEPESKINLCVDNIYNIWNDGKADKLTQLVFSDLSTPKEGVFSVYTDIRDKLIRRGVPQEEIAFIHDADTEVKKKELFAKVRSGSVRVLIGSTAKMGAGTNCQDRLIALHDLDCPWRPGDLQQRAGRIIRQGNMNPEVHIYRYVTEATFDAYLWQTIENKQKFISQIMTSKSPVRACDDIDEATLSYAEVKALCAGDDRIREKMDLDIEVSKLKLLKANHQSQQFRMQDDIARHYPVKIENYKQVIAGLEKDNNTAVSSPHPTDGFCGMKVNGSFYADKEEAGKAILDSCKSVTGAEPVTIGSYRGFSMAMSVEDFGRQFVLTLRGEMSHRVELGKDVRGNIVRIDNALSQIPARIQAAQAQLENVKNQLETAKAEVNKPFPKEDELKTKSARLSELNAELNIDERTPTCEKEKPSVLEKLKSTQTVSTVPKKTKDYER